MMKMIPVFSALRRLRLSCGRKQGAANDPRQRFGGRICNCGFFVTITVRGLPSRFHFHFGYTKYHHRVKSYGSIEPSPTFGTVATISRRLLPKIIAHYGAIMLCLGFCSVWGNNAPSGNYPKAPPSISSLPARSPLHFPPRERKAIQFFPLVCSKFSILKKEK